MAKVLIVRMSSFGDVAMLVPVVHSVATKYPQDRFYVMTRRAFAPLFESLGFNVNVLIVDVNGKHKGVLGLFRLASRLLAMGFSHIADVHDVLRSKVIRAFFTIAGRKVSVIDKGRAEKAHMIATKQLEPPLKTTVERYRETFDRLGFPADLTFNSVLDFMPVSSPGLQSLPLEKKTGRWIGVAPFAKHKGKIWPLEKMEKVISILSEEPNTTVILFGAGAEEKAILEEWNVKYKNTLNVVGKMNLQQELVLISHIDVMLTMDSANMHLASLVRTPVVSIWGATHPSLGFYGFGQDLHNAVQIDLECRPCSVYGDLPCQRGDYACLIRIDEQTVINKIHQVLASIPKEDNSNLN
ncbi:MAG: glycosyltransferase family 9 protein [Dysgonomonas sp.]